MLEPWQRDSRSRHADDPDGGRLTVARHVIDLHEFIHARFHGSEQRPILIGHSWGAMLALAYAAAHPDSLESVALIGCGTFDEAARRRFQDELSRRTEQRIRTQLEAIEALGNADDRLARAGQVMLPIFSHDVGHSQLEASRCDSAAHEETWNDMLQRQARGDYPDAFGHITCPVVMFHGADDPHPGSLIRDTLQAHISHLQYQELARCGHYPWLELHARDDFIRHLVQFIRDRPERST